MNDAQSSTPLQSNRIATRQIWAVCCLRVAWISGIFTLILSGLLIHNSTRLYSGLGGGKIHLVDAKDLAPLKAALRENPKNDQLVREIRQADRTQRMDYFRREHLSRRGGVVLLASALLFIISLRIGQQLKNPPFRTPSITALPPNSIKLSIVAAKSVVGATLGIATLATTLFWDTDSQWQHNLTKTNTPTASHDEIDATWFPTDAEVSAQWPRFRGPSGSGTTNLDHLPESWDVPNGKNVLWKSEIRLPGENSPVIWGNQVFLTGANKTTREVYCYDATTGSLTWKEPVSIPQNASHEAPEVMEDTGYAAPTAATDGRRVFAIFANGDIAGFTTAGKRLWARNLGTPENMYGYANSLTLWHHRVIVLFDQADADAKKSNIMALDANTGATVWTTPRQVPNSWATPILIKHENREQIITTADPWVIAYDPATGKELWKASCMKGDVATSPTYANGLVYVGSDQGAIVAIRPDGSGDVTNTHIAWKNDESGLPDMCSMLCDGPRVYTLVFGVLHAFDALTGMHLWEHDTTAKFQASPTMIRDHLHLLSTEGVDIAGIADNQGFKETGRSPLGEGTGASHAFAGGHLYLRGKKHLFCIGSPHAK